MTTNREDRFAQRGVRAARQTSRRRPRERRGAILVLTAVLIALLVAMVAFAVDIGYIVLVRTQLQAAADAAALACAGTIVQGTDTAEQQAYLYAGMYKAAGMPIAREQVEIRFGQWDTSSRRFTPSTSDRTAAEVTVHCTAPLFLGRLLGKAGFDSEASAVATFPPRDIMLVLDYSGSMCYDSQLRSIGRLGRSAVEANLQQMYQELGSPKYGKMTWTPQYISSSNTTQVLKTLGLNKVAYPYPSGSWSDFVSYVMTDGTISQAGYRKKYGYLTWMNYLQAKQAAYSQTPDLWKTSEQPITAVKDATDLLVAYLEEHCPADRLGLSIYTSTDGTAILEKSLTHEFATVSSIVRHRQAGHYQPYTNISAGMKTARLELQNHARAGVFKLMVLMTDGEANRPGSVNQAKAAVITEAQAALQAGIPILTIALGVEADTDLMQQVADITKGAFFEIPGGQSVADYEEQLKEVFRRVASDRKLQLVQ